MASFRTIRKALGPPWLTVNGDSGLVGYALDMMKDAYAERARLGLLARFPQQDPTGTPAPADALAAQGKDRRVVRGINESDASYAARLPKWLDDRRTAGNSFALMQKLSEYCGPGTSFKTVDARGNWYQRDAAGTRTFYWAQSNWNWDGRNDDGAGQEYWSRYWVIIYPATTLWQTKKWGTKKWGVANTTWGTTATKDQVATIRSIIADWKPAGTININVIIALDPASFSYTAGVSAAGMPGGGWGQWSKNSAGTQVAARLSTARYWDGSV